MTAAARYVRPGRSTALFNSVVAGFTRMGLSIWGSRILGVRGRTSGEMRTTPVNLLTVDGVRYLVAPRGVTQWVRNIRVAGEAELRLGRGVEPIRVTELTEAEKPAILRAYLRRWKFEVGVFFDGVDASASDETLRQIGPKHPVFRVLAAGE
jgi:deazaflavin-dependent oxidoreductase (nitroreductase family)